MLKDLDPLKQSNIERNNENESLVLTKPVAVCIRDVSFLTDHFCETLKVFAFSCHPTFPANISGVKVHFQH